MGRPKGPGRDRLTVRLLPATQTALERLADELPGMTPNRLVAALIEQATPQLEGMAQALEEQRGGEGLKATERLIGIIAPITAGLAALDAATISKGLENAAGEQT